ncbi:hypothetical protein QN277_005527 [Acacia crassicarpa]|uniref:F-box domain-containing protein n=1 Tax=Acacia crassicarpa TaxID=499986 RepID=A0AAE1IWM2_9FABA|nr:hypothetical protein QN277_005527 [Acacia crassicarpa]
MESEGDKPFLPPEIIINILKRLPVKFILRFRSLCKDWKNLFNTRHFIAQHASFSAHQNPLLLLHEADFYDSGKPPSLRLVNRNMETVQNLSISSIDSFKHHWSAIGSCNGLVCVRVHNLGRDGSSKLCLWNPAIRDVKEIPLATRKDKLESCKFGFGFCSLINDYKIVNFYKIKNKKNANKNKKNVAGGHDGVEVYSLNTNSWKELEIRAVLKNTTIKSNQVSVDGTIFWFGAQQDSSHVVVSFDIGTQVFTLTPVSLPFEPRGFPMTHLSVYHNKFAIFHHYFNNSWNFIDIGVMGDVAGESGKSFSCTDRYDDFDSSEYHFDLLCIWRDDIVFREPDKLRLFNVTTQEWKDFPDSVNYECRLGVNYEESLVSVWNT